MNCTRLMVFGAALLVAVLVGCGEGEPTVAPGIFAALGEPMPSATAAQRVTFERGRQVAMRRFSAAEGAGPDFNVTFCGACHERPVLGGSAGRYRNFLLVGQRLNDGSFAATGINGVQPQYSLLDRRRSTDPLTNLTATRNPVPFFGVGLLAEITDEEILSREDPDDADGDGISGRANFDRGFVGRFGRKSQSVAIESFIRGPLFNHMGITTNPLSPERRAALPVASRGTESGVPQQTAALGTLELEQVGAPNQPTVDDDEAPDPELNEADLFDLIAFSMLLAAPQPDAPTDSSERGRRLFDDAGCADCHVAALRGPRGLVPAWSDLLLHDMGEKLADGITMGEASGQEFRTAPLWGLAATGPYLHDGRADTIDEAIRWHGGEAARARDAFVAMPDTARNDVLAFLESLGGRAQQTPGLLAPDAPIPAVGAYGGPVQSLDDEEMARFARGRALFDRDAFLVGGRGAGLGPRFNGDACRACHFDPVIGGAGPADVDVIRQGIVDEATGMFRMPQMGTMAHRFASATDARPPIDAAANVFEARQTPALFGLGLIEAIAEADILARADPEDADGDGVSGRAHMLSDGRLGRFGWKANVPSIAEFARDALANEMGITLPAQEGQTFGFLYDEDEVPDPEISVEELRDLVFFLQMMAPPPRMAMDGQQADGEMAFDEVGCTSCHVANMTTTDGQSVALYSDLLLHEVALPWSWGIEEGDAAMGELRTPPLWGLATTAPYMHDGSAPTVLEAILAHAGEASAAREAFLALPLGLQEAVVAFLETL